MNTVAFGSICKLQNGRAFKPSDWSDSGDPIIRIQNLNDDSKPFNYCNFEVDKKFHINSGDLLFSWSGTPGTSFGAFFWRRGFGLLNQHIFKVTVDDNAISKDYLRYAINSKLHEIIEQAHGGVGLKHITKGKLEAIQIPLPPLDEQKRIAAILDKADAIRQKRKQAIALADEFLRSVFLEMFGDPVTNPKGWEVKALSEFSKVVTGNTPPRSEADNYGDHIEWIKSDNINTPSHFLTEATEKLSEKGEAKGRVVERGSILMTCIAGSLSCIGNIALANRSVAFNQQINAIVPTEISMSEFLYGLMLVSKKQIQDHSTNSMKGMISKGVLSSIKFPLPPLQEQKKYANVFRSYITFLDQMDKHAIDSVDMFNALSQKAFSGQL
ncbi:restriction endonuclease subunit S [Vibrio vulnificus]|uniref:restriction endonuclease subunit S n=1 Tax=Vibrio vulnificus TaxID=672 RepID=UPI000D3E8EE8|nr:restriction endonuclease subunit S [Vibrio vulnificus]PUZ96648.1 restriction endonuclease subunit S [Vibrio vulnificus]HAS6027978.1 restriction endonuclease subunit S [Vibrio vulnificus]HAS6113116.1 restriction endonuclease subunit S [Vibrio vulnificus]HAS6122022.1 restriction endonuclease subunit S [Vibrio vulnificus]HAS6126768.1 restriction endonuclease subunit S [Vibrio vulnificus]